MHAAFIILLQWRFFSRARAGGRNLLKTIFFWWEIFSRKARARRCFGRQKDGQHNGRKILPRRLHVPVARRIVRALYYNLILSTCAWVCVPPKTCPLHVREQWTTWRWRHRSRRKVLLYNTRKSRSLVLCELQSAAVITIKEYIIPLQQIHCTGDMHVQWV